MLEKSNLVKILYGDIDVIDQVNVRDPETLSENRVTIVPQHVRKMLKAFLQGKISADDLTKWARFICLRMEYICVPTNICPLNPKFSEIANYYEDMMYVIQRLSTPEIDGEVTEERVKQYLAELDKYKDDDMHKFFK